MNRGNGAARTRAAAVKPKLLGRRSHTEVPKPPYPSRPSAYGALTVRMYQGKESQETTFSVPSKSAAIFPPPAL